MVQGCQVAVSVATYAIDRPYTYLIPPAIEDRIRPGMRAMVPFGRGNRRVEGIVLRLLPLEHRENCKYLISLLDSQPVAEPEELKLALWMRERYFCTVYEAVRAMLPAGLYFSLRDSFSLAPQIGKEAAYEAAGNSRRAAQLLDMLFANGGRMERGAIMDAFGHQDPSAALKLLTEREVIVLETSAQRGVGEKTEKIAVLALTPEEGLEAVAKGGKKSAPRRAVMELLCDVGAASMKDIRYFTGASPATVRAMARAGLVTLEEREVLRSPVHEHIPPAPPPTLNKEQQAAYEGILALLEERTPECALLFGVTGSGKTAVYLQLIARVLEQGRTALVLVPEIALTPQLLRIFAGQFGSSVAVLHSSLSAGERYDEWKRAKRGEARVVIGTRSAVFAPLPDLGLVILDEEQEGSYKSEQSPRYHARDVAKFRCVQAGAVLLLGSATPSVESMYAAETGAYRLFRLEKRYNARPLPDVITVDLREELRQGRDGPISRRLRQELEDTIDRGEQAILFLNRRGTSRMLLCAECGGVPQCPRCTANLTWHKANGRLMCHYCGYSQPVPRVCPSCGGQLTAVGAGTQRVQEELEALFPQVEILRMDADTVSATHSHEKLLRQFEEKKAQVLIGTQMVAKGLDFPNVTLVGVISADQSLYAEDFRAAERTFSLLTQVVGRAGRGEKRGRAVIQTYTPGNEVVTAAAKQDYDTFYQSEIRLRRARGCPPFCDLYVLIISGRDEGAVLKSCMRLRDGLDSWKEKLAAEGQTVTVLGPVAAPVLKVNDRYRYRLTVSGRNTPGVRRMLAHLLKTAQNDRFNRGVAVNIDLNPLG